MEMNKKGVIAAVVMVSRIASQGQGFEPCGLVPPSVRNSRAKFYLKFTASCSVKENVVTKPAHE